MLVEIIGARRARTASQDWTTVTVTTSWQQTPRPWQQTPRPMCPPRPGRWIQRPQRTGRRADPPVKVEGLVLRKRGGSPSLPGRIEEACKPGPFAALDTESGQRSSTVMRTSRVFACSRWQRPDNVYLGARPSNVVMARALVCGQQVRRSFYPGREASIEPGGAVAAELHTQRLPRETRDRDRSPSPAPAPRAIA